MRKIGLIFILLLLAMSIYAREVRVITVSGKKISIELDNESEVLRFDHIVSPLKEIENPECLENIEKVVFSFVDLTNAEELFWSSLSHVSNILFDYTDVEDFTFLRYLPELKVISFRESNSINNFSSINLSSNAKLEYFELNGLKFIDFEGFFNVPKSLKYLVIANSKLTEADYSKITESLDENIYLVIDYMQMKYFSNFKNLLNQNSLKNLWEEFNVKG
ncbi:MAG TPA: hypothetical protein PLG87_07550 [Treponemataceae bacterium]|nr:hypothetical protein [Treponemataceae bacterium]